VKDNSMNDFPVSFCADTYRQLHHDLREMDSDTLRDHYNTFGIVEGRQACKVRDRNDFIKLFDGIRPALEIGAFDSPLLKQDDVKHFDVLDQVSLKVRAHELGRNSDRVPYIDYVSPTGELSVIQDKFELIISSHAIEHTPDLIAHLLDISNLLTANGVYALMVPDCRYCFDHFIPPSSIAEVLQAHVEGRKVHTLASVIEHRALTTHNDPAKHWDGNHGSSAGAEPDRVLAAISEWQSAKGGYIDVHAWQFTPQSFETLISLLGNASLVNLKPIRVYNPVRGANEFLVILGQKV
jgi:hypothetical protein